MPINVSDSFTLLDIGATSFPMGTRKYAYELMFKPFRATFNDRPRVFTIYAITKLFYFKPLRATFNDRPGVFRIYAVTKLFLFGVNIW
jgi:hypothetical protein